jgi:polyhydroxybutyrate depolymerase
MRMSLLAVALLVGCSRERSGAGAAPERGVAGAGAVAGATASATGSGSGAGAEAPRPVGTPSAALASAVPSGSVGVLPSGSASGAASPAPPEVPVLGGVGITVPVGVRPGARHPFVLYLHGLGGSGKAMVDALGVAQMASDRRFVYAAPNGAMSGKKQRFWNAWGACCDLEKSGVDHVTALRRLLATAAAHPSVDPAKIYVIGFSNGGFMAHRLACEVDGIAAIASVAGAGPGEGERCAPASPVAVLQVHGDADDIIAYGGGHPLRKATLPRHPAASETVAGWAQREGCGSRPAGAAGGLDLEEKLAGDETSVSLYGACRRPVALWTVHGGNHFIATSRRAQEAIYRFLEANTR